MFCLDVNLFGDQLTVTEAVFCMLQNTFPTFEGGKKMKKLSYFLVMPFLYLGLFACGGGSSSEDISTESPSVSMTGQFVDSAVSGLDYICSSGESDVTNSGGEFTCPENDAVDFYIGQFFLGTSVFKLIVTPYDLYPENEKAAINVAQLLQTIDVDGNVENGIVIPEGFDDLDFLDLLPGDTNFGTEVETVLGSLIDRETAKVHLDGTIISFPSDLTGKTYYGVYYDAEATLPRWDIEILAFPDANIYTLANEDGEVDETGTYSVSDGSLTIKSNDGQHHDIITPLSFDVKNNAIIVQWGDVPDHEYLFRSLEEANTYKSSLNNSSETIIGSWISTTAKDDLLAFNFYDDGTYVHMEVDFDDPDEISGMEWGTYSVDKNTGLVTHSQTFDNNGDTGYTDLVGSSELYLKAENNVLTMSIDENGDGIIDENGVYEFNRIVSRGILGSWINNTTENDFLAFIFYDDGSYVHMEVDFNDPDEISGMEWGTYSVDENTGLVTVTQIFDKNGTTGLTDFVGTPDLYVDVEGDILTIFVDENGNGTIDDTLELQRHSTAIVLKTLLSGQTLYTTISGQQGTLESWVFNTSATSFTYYELVDNDGEYSSSTVGVTVNDMALIFDDPEEGNIEITISETTSDYIGISGESIPQDRLYFERAKAEQYFGL